MSTIEKALAKQKEAALKNNKTLTTDDHSAEYAYPIVNKDVVVKQKKGTDETVAETHKAKILKTKKNSGQTSEHIVLNGEHLTERGFIYNRDSAHHIQEEFRHIKRKLLNNAFGPAAKTLHHSNLIMVTSTNPNEGKTFISINLALSIALEQDKTVLLIDADVLRPSIHRELEFEPKKGLLEYLLGEVTKLSNIIYSTNIANLKLIPAGRPHHLTNELLASSRMEELAKELADRYPDRIVIIDCPPIMGVTETPVLSNLVGQAVIVVEESKTKVDDIKKAVIQLNEDIATGFVMNKALKSKKDMYGYYGYGYGKK